MNYRIKGVEVTRYPVLRITFDDGLSGEYDVTRLIDDGPIFAPLRSEEYFRTVAVAEGGRSFGLNLDQLGHETDFCADATRIEIEAQIVKELADRYRAGLSVAA